jgi:hypothetical protein
MPPKPQTSFHVRFTFPSPGEQQVTTADDADGGILLVAASTNMPGWLDLGVVLVVDADGLGLVNPGASATNCITSIVGAYREIVSQVLDHHETHLVWVQIDSMGNCDQFRPDGVGSLCNSVTWTPMPGVGAAPPRSVAAFLQAYPVVSGRLLERVQAMTGCELETLMRLQGKPIRIGRSAAPAATSMDTAE